MPYRKFIPKKNFKAISFLFLCLASLFGIGQNCSKSGFTSMNSQDLLQNVGGLEDGDINSRSTLYSTGSNVYWGEDPFAKTIYPTPVEVKKENTLKIVKGDSHVCDLVKINTINTVNSRNTVRCWGNNSYGQLGRNDFTYRGFPITVDGSLKENVTDIASGSNHVCALTENGKIYCWGDGSYGQLGIGDDTNHKIPVLVSSTDLNGKSIGTWKQLGAGDYHTCGINDKNDVYCWGSNGDYQIGGGDLYDDILKPKLKTINRKDFDKSEIMLTVNIDNSCVWNEKIALCWGSNSANHLSTLHLNQISDAYPVSFNLSNTDTIIDLQINVNSTCILTKNSKVICRSMLPSFGEPVEIDMAMDTTDKVKKMALGYESICVVTNNNKVNCYGNNYYQQLGNGKYEGISPDSAKEIFNNINNEEISDIAAIGKTYCFNTTNKRYCWGDNSLGTVSKTNFSNVNYRALPKQNFYSNYDNIVSVDTMFCGLKKKSVYCWGNNIYVGNRIKDQKISTVPKLVEELKNYRIVELTSDNGNICALSEKGKVYCIGYNAKEQSGEINFPDSATIKQILILDGVTLALSNVGTLYTWGNSIISLLGRASSNSDDDNNVLPIKQTIDNSFINNKVVKFAGGNTTVCALVNDSKINNSSTSPSPKNIYCWGKSSYGQLGTGIKINDQNDSFTSILPLKVNFPVNSLNTDEYWVDIKSSQYDFCARTNMGTVYCWGYDMPKNEPTKIDFGKGETPDSLFSSYENFCFHLISNKVYCFNIHTKGTGGPNSLNNEDDANSLKPITKSANDKKALLFSKISSIYNGNTFYGTLAKGNVETTAIVVDAAQIDKASLAPDNLSKVDLEDLSKSNTENNYFYPIVNGINVYYFKVNKLKPNQTDIVTWFNKNLGIYPTFIDINSLTDEFSKIPKYSGELAMSGGKKQYTDIASFLDDKYSTDKNSNYSKVRKCLSDNKLPLSDNSGNDIQYCFQQNSINICGSDMNSKYDYNSMLCKK